MDAGHVLVAIRDDVVVGHLQLVDTAAVGFRDLGAILEYVPER